MTASASLFGWVNQRRRQLEQTLELPVLLERTRGLLSSGEPEAARQLATRAGMRALRNVAANSAWETVALAELNLDCAERLRTGAFGATARAPHTFLSLVTQAQAMGPRSGIFWLSQAAEAKPYRPSGTGT